MKMFTLLSKNWWVLTCILITGAIYLQTLHKKTLEARRLQSQVKHLIAEQESLTRSCKHLAAYINSKNDPAFTEILLKESLGVIAENELKIIFKK